jgi:hypothetical protein
VFYNVEFINIEWSLASMGFERKFVELNDSVIVEKG